MTTYFSQQLQKLFALKRKPDGTPYSQDEVLQGTKGVLTRGTLWKLRMGRTKNPSYESIQALADFFQVSPAYFFQSPGEKDQVDADNASLNEEEGIDLDKIAMRAVNIYDPTAKDAILSMIQIIKSYQQNDQVGCKHETANQIKGQPGTRESVDDQSQAGSGDSLSG